VPEKFLKTRFRMIATLSALTLALTGCAELPLDAPTTPVDYRTCLETQTATDAMGINEVADYAVKQAVVTYGVNRTVQKSSVSKFAANTEKLVQQGCDLIVVSGSAFADALSDQVAGNPNVNFLYLTDQPAPALLANNFENLSVFQVDSYEVGLLLGELAGTFAKDHTVAAECTPAGGERLVSGIRAGIAGYSANSGNPTTFQIAETAPASSSLRILLGCKGDWDFNDYLADYVKPIKAVGYGRDIYLNENYADSKAILAATVIPNIRPRIMEVIASDLEGDFIGGRLGSTVAQYGNGGIVISPEHEVAYPENLLKRLEQIALDYEVTLK
jgi:basic membrane protein A